PGGHAVDDAAPEQLPGPRLELAADELQGAPVELAAQLPLLLVRLVPEVRLVLDEAARVGTSGGGDLLADAADGPQHGVAGPPGEPAAEGVGRAAVAERLQGGERLGEDLLHDVVDVLGRDAAAAAPVADQRVIQRDQPLPGLGLPLARPL